MRVGTGYDIHPLVEGRPLVLGGISIRYDKGLMGHSDADVLIHAVCNALLGAAGGPDLGTLYPDTDPTYKDYSSTRFLEAVRRYLGDHGFRVENIDAVIIAQAPRLSPFIEEMRSHLAKALGVDRTQIGIKAATPEGIGALGRGEGIAAQAVCLLDKIVP